MIAAGSPERSHRALYELGAAAWPELALTEAAFSAHLQRLERERGPGQSPRYPADLFLACACAEGVAGALRAFETKLGPEIDAMLRRFSAERDTRDELCQCVRTRLFAHPSGAKIAKYAGTSPLVYWVRLIASRTARNLYRGRANQANPARDAAVYEAIASRDVEGTLMKAELTPLLKTAFAEAFDALEEHERTVLRWTVVNGLTIDALAGLLRVHRATAARRAAAARERLASLTRARVAERAGLSLESALRVVESQLELSVSRVFMERGVMPDSGRAREALGGEDA
jgi:RNA polymerase sigma-70 factor (ECF subfamily)